MTIERSTKPVRKRNLRAVPLRQYRDARCQDCVGGTGRCGRVARRLATRRGKVCGTAAKDGEAGLQWVRVAQFPRAVGGHFGLS